MISSTRRVVASICAGWIALGCGSPQPAGVDAAAPSDAGQDAAAPPDAGHDAAIGLDAGPTNCAIDYAGCTTPEDHTADTMVTVNVVMPSATTYGYSPSCIRIHTGTTVVLPGSALHPLIRASCSPAESPLPSASTTGGSFTFTTPGNYGYWCQNHGADNGTGMAGLIVVE